jgi:hypothetical protein
MNTVFTSTTLAIIIVFYSTYHAIYTFLHRQEIQPTTHFGWNIEQWTISGAYAVLGLMLLRTALRGPATTLTLRYPQILICTAITALSILVYLRYFFLMTGVISLVSMFYVLALSLTLNEENSLWRRLLVTASAMSSVALMLFYYISFSTIGK